MGTQVVGPLDGRRKVTRCLSCAKRHIKCDGGHRCTYCIRQKQACVPQHREYKRTFAFVSQSQSSHTRCPHGCRHAEVKKSAVLLDAIAKSPGSLFLDCFVLFSQKMSTFTPRFASILSDLLVLMTASPVLNIAIRALGAMSASRLGNVGFRGEVVHLQVLATHFYQRAIGTLRVCLLDQKQVRGDDVLWATFLLGLFELLCEGSGDGYVSHVFYGTSMLLQLVGPSRSMSPLRRAFYDIFRVCEASRALPHNETTILSEPTWLRFQQAHQQQAHQESRDCWNPLEEITTLMIDASAFNLRSRNTISRISEEERATNPSVLCLAVDGQRLQRAICDWHDHALAHLSQAHHHPTTKPNINLALLKYHALLLFLSGGPDDSFPNWIILRSPALTQSETCDHVTLIIDLSEQVLRHGSAPGVLLFFPLTIAGCRASREDQRGRVLSILDRVRCSGFGTAKRVRETILQCWARRDAEGRGCRELAAG